MGSNQRYTWPWMHMVCRSELLLQKVPEQIAKKPVRYDGLSAGTLLADRGYDTKTIFFKSDELDC